MRGVVDASVTSHVSLSQKRHRSVCVCACTRSSLSQWLSFIPQLPLPLTHPIISGTCLSSAPEWICTFSWTHGESVLVINFRSIVSTPGSKASHCHQMPALYFHCSFLPFSRLHSATAAVMRGKSQLILPNVSVSPNQVINLHLKKSGSDTFEVILLSEGFGHSGYDLHEHVIVFESWAAGPCETSHSHHGSDGGGSLQMC